MKKLYIFLIGLSSLCATTLAQQVPRFQYDYDANGNRVKRELIDMSKSSFSATVDDSISEQPKETFVIRKDDFSIYPNPTKGHLKVEINAQTEVKSINIDIVNMRGQSIYRSTEVSAFYDLDISNAVNGAYILVIRVNDRKYEWKIIKE